MSSSGNISCECDVTERPVDYLGDSMCKTSSSVREIIKKYEPDREITPSSAVFSLSSPLGSSTNAQQFKRKLDNHSVVEEQRVSTSPQPSARYTVPRPYEKPSENRNVINGNNKNFEEDFKSSSNYQNKNSREATYQSKTAIIKVPNGVRIVTEIIFDGTQQSIPECWHGSKIETEIPPSKILNDFHQFNLK